MKITEDKNPKPLSVGRARIHNELLQSKINQTYLYLAATAATSFGIIIISITNTRSYAVAELRWPHDFFHIFFTISKNIFSIFLISSPPNFPSHAPKNQKDAKWQIAWYEEGGCSSAAACCGAVVAGCSDSTAAGRGGWAQSCNGCLPLIYPLYSRRSRRAGVADRTAVGCGRVGWGSYGPVRIRRFLPPGSL